MAQIKPPKKVTLEDKHAESTLNLLIGDLYSRLDQTISEVKKAVKTEILPSLEKAISEITSPTIPPVVPPGLLLPTLTVTTGADETTIFTYDSFLLFSWNNVGEGISYNLRYKKTSVTNWTLVAIRENKTEPTRTHRIGRLDCGVEFEYAIQSVKGEETSDWSTTGTITTWADTTIPSTLTGITLKTIVSLFEVRWAKSVDADAHQILVYVNTSASVPTAGTLDNILKRVAHPTTRTLLPLGAHTEGTSPITLTTGVPYYFWVSVIDKAGNESLLAATTPTNATVTPGITVDTTAPVPNPPIDMASTITPQKIGLISRFSAELSWGVCTDDSGRPVHYHVKLWPSGATKVTDITTFTNSTTVRGLDSSTTYYWKVAAEDWYRNITNYCADQTLAVTDDTIAPDPPTGVVLNTILSLFEVKTVKNTEADMHEYIVYVNTSVTTPTKGDTEHIIKRLAHPTTRTTIPLGAKTEAGTNIITLTSGTPYYFWVSAADVAHNESDLVATTPTSATVTTGLSDDTSPPTPNPPTGMSSSITPQNIGLLSRLQAVLSCNACTDASGKPVHYHFKVWKTGETTTVTDITSYTNSTTVRNLDANTTYYWKVAAEDWANNLTDYCADQTLSTTDDTTAPTAPTVTSTSGMFQFFILKWVKNTESDLNGYIVYVNTTNSTPTKADGTKIISRTSRYSTNKILRIGEVTETSSGGITLTAKTTYYFWLSAIDVAGNESNLTSFGSATTTGGLTADIPIINTPAQMCVPSAFYSDIRAHNDSSTSRHFTADFITLHNAANTETFALNNVSQTASGSGSSGWRYFYLEYKVSTTTTQLICSSTDPNAYTMSSGYDYFVYMGSCHWDGSQFPTTYQFNNHVWFSPTPILSNGDCTSGTWTSISMTNYIPATATMWYGYMGRDALQVGQSGMAVAADSGGTFSVAITLGSASAPTAGYGPSDPCYFVLPVLTAQTCYWKASQHNYHCYAIGITGFVDDI
jgi:hypothetical protein